MLVTNEIMRSDLFSRVILNKCPFSSSVDSPQLSFGSSVNWLSDLLSDLDGAGGDVDEVRSVFRAASEASDLSDVRFELSRIPVWYRLRLYSKLSANGISKIDAYGVYSAGGQFYEVGSSECPKKVLPKDLNKNDYKRGLCVQCSYPVELAKEVVLDTGMHWSVSNSIVDWICDFSRTEGLRSSPRLSVEHIDDDVCYKLSYRSTALSPSTQESEDVSLSDKLLGYIVQNAPVSTASVLSKQFASRRHTFDLLSALERQDKIERVEHGLIIAL